MNQCQNWQQWLAIFSLILAASVGFIPMMLLVAYYYPSVYYSDDHFVDISEHLLWGMMLWLGSLIISLLSLLLVLLAGGSLVYLVYRLFICWCPNTILGEPTEYQTITLHKIIK